MQRHAPAHPLGGVSGASETTMGKRLFDILVSTLGLLVMAPALAVLAVLVTALNGRPVLFRQRRVGRGGREFALYKFRTMTVAPGAEAGSFDAGSVARVTPLGRFLRKTKLDELPQLWSVLRGDMSLVGPRPEVRKWVDVYPERWRYVHMVRPGITDPASIAYRNEEAILANAANPEEAYRHEILPRKLSLYEEYVRSHTLLGDVRILARTAGALLRGRG